MLFSEIYTDTSEGPARSIFRKGLYLFPPLYFVPLCFIEDISCPPANCVILRDAHPLGPNLCSHFLQLQRCFQL